MAGLFDTFSIGTRGLSVQQSKINTTSHNIANASTEGYSRQRAVAVTTRPFGGMSRFDSYSVGQVGTGAEIQCIQRIRDSFLDYQVRNENGKTSNYEVHANSLQQVENIFGEPSDSGIQELLQKFYDSFNSIVTAKADSASRTVALQNASSLADALNHTYTQLEQQVSDAQDVLQININDANSTLDQINELNKQIASVVAVGQTPNDLMDTRDNLLDKLSSEFGIKVVKQENEAIDLKTEAFQSTANPLNNLINSNPNDMSYTRFSYVDNVVADPAGTTLTISYKPLGDLKADSKTITVTGTVADLDKLKGSLERNRVLTADKDGNVTYRAPGTPPTTVVVTASPATMTVDQLNSATFKTYEYDSATNNVDTKNIRGQIAGNQGIQAEIKTYMDKLDVVAASLAYTVNAIQTGNDGTTGPSGTLANQELIFVKDTAGTTDTGITAKTIAVNKKLLNDVSLLNCREDDTKGESDGARAAAISNLRVLKIDLTKVDLNDGLNNRADFFAETGLTFKTATHVDLTSSGSGTSTVTYYNDIINTLGVDSEAALQNAINQGKIMDDLETQRQSISGVSLDEEMANIVQFQHAYQANAKIISVVDQLLDVVINGLMK